MNSGGGPETSCDRRRDGNGRRLRPSLRAGPPRVGRVTAIGRRKLGISHPKLMRFCIRLRGLLRARGDAFGSGRRDLLPRHLYGVGIGRGTPQDNRGLHHRVRARSPRQQSRRGVLIPERERRGPDGTKPDGLRALQGRGRERAARGGLSPRLHLSARLYLPRGAAKEPNFSYRLLRAIYPVFRVLFPNQVIPADDLARAMVDVALRETQERETWFSRTVTSEPWPVYKTSGQQPAVQR
jgi:hypothetical protein